MFMYLAMVFLVVSFLAALFGFNNLSNTTSSFAKGFFYLAVLSFLVSAAVLFMIVF